MPRYFFDIKNGHRLVDHAGIDLADDVAATKQGNAVAAQIEKDVPETPVKRRVAVRDEDGKEVTSIRIRK